MRTFDASIHNRIGNDPSVVTAIKHDPALGPIFFDELAKEPDYFALLHNGKDAASIFEFRGPGIWESHTMFLPSCRGRKGIEAAKAMIHEMFTEHGADILWGATPIDNRAAQMFNRFIGAKTLGTGVHAVSGPVRYFRVDKAEWVRDHWNSAI